MLREVAMYTAEQLSQEIRKYGIKLAPGTVCTYASKELIPKDINGIYPTETLEQLYASYKMLHRYGVPYITYSQISMARQLALGDYDLKRVPEYETAQEWLRELNLFLKIRE